MLGVVDAVEVILQLGGNIHLDKIDLISSVFWKGLLSIGFEL